MASGMFWALSAGLAALVGLVLVGALRRGAAESVSTDADLAVYRDQLAEIERDLARGTIGMDEAARLRAEVGRRVIDADRHRGADQAGPRAMGAVGVAALIVAIVVPGAIAGYLWIGAPGYPDMPLGSRLQALDAAIAARPGQSAQLERNGTVRDPAQDERLVGELSAISDADALRARYRAHLLAGEMGNAVRAQERLLTLLGDASQAQDHADLALALVLEAQGYVSPEAEDQLRETLRRDMTNEIARYLVGEMFLQGGRFDQTFKFWRPLVEDGNADLPWVASARDRIAVVAQLAGVRYQLPDAAQAGVAEMSEEDRAAMIEGMVAQLSDRLATEGGDVEDWNRLIRSLVVLERLDEAQKIYDEAKAKFQGRPSELSFLRLAAVEGGLTP